MLALAAVAALAGPAAFEAAQPPRPRQHTVTSPDGHLTFELQVSAAGGMRYRVRRDAALVLDWSTPGMIVDGVSLTDNVLLSDVISTSATDLTYPTRGVHALARDRSSNLALAFQHARTHVDARLEIRVFDTGAAFRFIVPEHPDSIARTPDEGTTFKLPPGAMTWSHDLHGHYEALYVKRAIEDVPAGDWAAPPLTYKLPGAAGYASITEAALTNYAGMALHADGRGGYVARLGHAHPVSYPYALRYRAEDVQRLARPAVVTGRIVTPWRVVLAAPDLNGLVNSDVLHNLAPAPDPALFPEGIAAPWVRPGRAVWRYLDGGDNTYEGLKGFTERAAKLGYEYHVVEGVWRQWTPEQLKAFGEHARQHKVGVLLWKHSREMQTPEQRRQFWELCRANGMAGAKIDFLDHEAKEVIDLYDAILREAAEHRLVVNVHGANKPTGMDRTWPNELTREAVWGFEHRGAAPWGPHNATLPFTRYLAGNGDYTPTVFGDRRRETSWPHQIATAIVFTSTLLVFGGHPQSFLDSPAADVLRAIPATWDETIVLPPSEIGEIAVMARRAGRDWFVASVNGAAGRTVRVVPRFLAPGRYTATIVRDVPTDAAAMTVDRVPLSPSTPLTFAVRPGGGFVALIRPE
ncbi:MAG TPA: glycoside hydrolase family 97 catalytic domain-containing protein [Vicinamibacterales bacterium]|nr:glycoside hydrolase family 97 catalytic domain-containing protein [Vicinamibacterales bacterium]